VTVPVIDVSAPRRAEDRLGYWGVTFTGRQFWPRDPRPGDICIEDIAHALSLVCRFGGMCRTFYSVAQHSVLVSETCEDENAFHGLLHDATEAYLGDIIRPLKRELSGYKVLEAMWAKAIGRAFKLGDELEHLPPDIKRADWIVLSTEHRDLMPSGGPAWVTDTATLPLTIEPWPPALAEQRFLDRFRLLQIGGRK
jgi:hypothetical protein